MLDCKCIRSCILILLRLHFCVDLPRLHHVVPSFLLLRIVLTTSLLSSILESIRSMNFASIPRHVNGMSLDTSVGNIGIYQLVFGITMINLIACRLFGMILIFYFLLLIIFFSFCTGMTKMIWMKVLQKLHAGIWHFFSHPDLSKARFIDANWSSAKFFKPLRCRTGLAYQCIISSHTSI